MCFATYIRMKKSPLSNIIQVPRKENMYRIYSKNISVDGKKIPVLEESVIMRLVREIGKGRQISLYLQDKINITVNIQPDGNIRVDGSLKELYDLETLNDILKIMIQTTYCRIK